MNIRLIAAVSSLLLTSLSFADDGWWSAAGGIGAYGKNHPTIRMVSEDLKIQLLEGRDAKVDVLFTFRNEGPATRVTMAFPEIYEMRTMGSLDGFETWVDGRKTKTVRKVLTKGDPEEGDSEGSAAWLKTVAFGSHQTRKVRVTYRGWYSGNSSGDLSLTYVLKTGASWKGPIGACKITVDWTRLKTRSAPYLDLDGAKWRTSRRRVQTATLVNWEPKDDLVISTIPGFWNFSINGKPLDSEGRGYYGKPYTAGQPSDPLIAANVFDRFFGGRAADGEWTDWKNPVSVKFGGAFEISGGKLKFATGKVVPLARGFKVLKKSNQAQEFVYVKDVVKALGGRFVYVSRDERVDIRF